MRVILATLPADISHQEVEAVKAQFQDPGSWVKLQGIPPFSYEALLYQVLTGLAPEWTAIYDHVEVSDYQVTQTAIVNEVARKLVSDIVRGMGKTVCQTDHILPEPLPEFVHLAARTFADLEPLVALAEEEIVKVVVLPYFVRHSKQVNVNNFFENKGLLEREVDGSIRWRETLAYHVGNGQVRINLLGREPGGVVTPGQEYDQVCDALTRMLHKQLIDPEAGSPVVQNIWRKEDLYDNEGDYFVRGPDLVLDFLSGYTPSPKSVGLDFDDKEISVSDEVKAIDSFLLLIWGPGINQGYSGTGHTLDVAPTLLHLLDLSIPRRLKGKVMHNVFTPEFLENHPVRYQPQDDLTAGEQSLIIDRLEALGYID